MQLQRPGQPPADDPQNIPRLWEDEVIYDDVAPWSPAADGTGNSLQRTNPQNYGNKATAWRVSVPSPGTVDFSGGIPGDFTNDGIIDVDDIDALYVQLRSPLPDSNFDLTGDGSVNDSDRDFMIFSIVATTYGDADLDGTFNSSDFVKVFQVGEYEDAVVGNSTWSEGDWNADGDFNTSDMVLAFQSGGYSAAASVKVIAQNLNEVTTIGGALAIAVQSRITVAGGDDSKDREPMSFGASIEQPVVNQIPTEQTRDAIFQREIDDWVSDDQGVDEVALALEFDLKTNL